MFPFGPGDVATYGWGTILFFAGIWILTLVGTKVMKAYQDHCDWKRKSSQERDKWERESESNQETWYRRMIEETVSNQGTANATLQRVADSMLVMIESGKQQIEILKANSEALFRIENLVIQNTPKRRVDFSKPGPGDKNHDKQTA